MNAPANLPTPVSLAEHLIGAHGSKERFGMTGSAVLKTAALIAAANADWDRGAVASFQEEQKIHQKVWGKLVSIARSQNLQTLPLEDLPASYTALYALEVMSPQELTAAVQEGLVRSDASSRSILDWTKAFRLRSTGIEQEVPLTLVLRQDLNAEQKQELLEALGKVADQFGAEVITGKGGIKQAGVKADLRKAKASEIEEELMRLLGSAVLDAPDALKEGFQVTSAADLIAGSRQTFTGFFQNLVGKVKIQFWRDYGHAYCLKIARDFNLTESRAERFQLKDRIGKATEKWKGEIPGFEAMTTEILKTYMRR
jgi:hypothetical protein